MVQRFTDTVRALLATGLLLIAGHTAQAATERVRNGDFASNSFDGWTRTGATAYVGAMLGYGHFGSIGATAGIEQELQTTAGRYYRLSFLLTNLSGDAVNAFDVSWAGRSLFSLSNAAAFPATRYSFDLLATGDSSTLAFSARHDPSYYDLDDISVVQVEPVLAAVPEPGSPAMLLSGLAFMALVAWRKAGRPGIF